MIKVAICDDEKIIVSQIEKILLKTSIKENIPIDIDVFFSGEKLEKEVHSGTQYDLLYLDIQMENKNGIEVAKNIREIDENVLLIYVSGYDKYLMELFRLDVFEFIKKPINYELFIKIFLEANEKICSKKIYFCYHYKREENKVLCQKILYFESIGRKIKIHLKSNECEIFNGKLNDVESNLFDGKIPFLRVHQSFLVNYHFIKSRSKTEVTLINGTKLPISEDRQRKISDQYGKLLLGEFHE